MSYADFMMGIQEEFLNQYLPASKDDHKVFRKKTVDALAETVTDLVGHLKPRTIVEIGAHGAEFSMKVKEKMPQARVVAIEANPVVFARHQPFVSNTGVEYLQKCIADENRSYTFKVPVANDKEKTTMGSLLSYQPATEFSEFDVDGCRLDDFLVENDSPVALWIDVEGAIGSVLAGATKTLQTCDLLFVELEATRRWEGQLLDTDVISLLAPYGLVPILRDIQRWKWQHNICFIRESKLSSPEVIRSSRAYFRKISATRKETKLTRTKNPIKLSLRSLLSLAKSPPAQASSTITPVAKKRTSRAVDSVGIVRFSVLSTTYNKFQAWTDQPFEEYASMIMNDGRMESRFRLFENVTLPSFDAQTDKNFTLLVVAPRLLPDKWRARLERLSNGRSYMKIIYVDETEFRMSNLSETISKQLVPDAEFFSTFRIDDDDAVKDNFIARLKRYHKRAFVGFGVSFTKGHYLDLDPTGPMVAVNQKQRTNHSVGLALISSREKPRCLFDYSDGHKNYHYNRPVIIDGRENSFLLVNHEFNDTSDLRHGDEYPLNVDQASEILSNLGYRVRLQDLMSARSSSSEK